MKKISVVIPIYNEKENIDELISSISSVMAENNYSYEIIAVDDGSRDGSYEQLKQIKQTNKDLKIIKFKKNYGQTQAIMAGFDASIGDMVITIDADLQNDPQDIPLLVEKIDQGYDIVSGWREKRKDNFIIRRLPSIIANKLISWFTGVNLHDYGCTLKAYKSKVIKNIRLYGQLHRFIPAVAARMGVSLLEIKVKHYPRKKGKSKYGIFRIWTVLLDLITVKFFLSYSGRPMQFFGSFGLVGMVFSFIIFIVTIYMKLMKSIDMTGNPLFYLAIFLGFIGMQCILMGLLGEINIRTYYESLNKGTYVIDEE
ncbi:MAG: glycosyltransferase family 2 protein [Candidatus Omnitrophica bacterium]|nr:glycosyltransferase family 2 protein [Candidatus Omnitrophota bacterium]